MCGSWVLKTLRVGGQDDVQMREKGWRKREEEGEEGEEGGDEEESGSDNQLKDVVLLRW